MSEDLCQLLVGEVVWGAFQNKEKRALVFFAVAALRRLSLPWKTVVHVKLDTRRRCG